MQRFLEPNRRLDKTISIGITVTTDLIRNFYIRMVSRFVFEHFQKVEIVLKPTGCTGFRNSIAGPEHTLCLVDTQGYLHLFDRHTIYGLEYSI